MKRERCRNSFAVVDGRPGSTVTCSVCGRKFKVTRNRRIPVHVPPKPERS